MITYTIEELHQLLSSEAYTYGVVSNSKIEKLNESNSWVSLNGNETQLTSGSYRLAFTTQDGNQVFVSTIF